VLTVDLHVHTIASGHALNTLYELAAEAADRQISAIAITDHGPRARGAPDSAYFHVLCDRGPRTVRGVRIYKGIEANILAENGQTDIPEYARHMFDIVLAALHPITGYRDAGRRANTRAVLNALAAESAIDILAHPVNAWFPVEIEPIVREACARGVLIELNNTTFGRPDVDAREVRKMIEATLSAGGRFAACSDAHAADELGGDTNIRRYIQDMRVPEAVVVNTSQERVDEFIAERRRLKWDR